MTFFYKNSTKISSMICYYLWHETTSNGVRGNLDFDSLNPLDFHLNISSGLFHFIYL